MPAPQTDSRHLSADEDTADANLKGRLLCVDDERQILTSLRRLFRRAGHQVITADSAAEGLKILADNKIDIVISDMRMPQIDGNQFLAEVASQWPNTIRMLLTGYSDMDSTIGAINNGGIYRYIPKP
ncbi:MAG: response regulator, partial [Pseudomonadota bacterium]